MSKNLYLIFWQKSYFNIYTKRITFPFLQICICLLFILLVRFDNNFFFYNLFFLKLSNLISTKQFTNEKMAKKSKHSLPILYHASIVFFPRWIFLLFNKSLKFWITNWWNTRQSETFLNDIQEKSILEQFIKVDELFLVDEMIKEYLKTHLQKFRVEIHKETIQLIKMHNK